MWRRFLKRLHNHNRDVSGNVSTIKRCFLALHTTAAVNYLTSDIAREI